MVKSVSLFSKLNDKHLRAVAALCKELKFKPGQVIVTEGEMGVGLYLIADGTVEVRRKGKTVSKMGKGDFFGEMSLLDAHPRSADVVATSASTCFGITDWSFTGLIKSEPEIALGLMKELVGRLRGTTQRLTE